MADKDSRRRSGRPGGVNIGTIIFIILIIYIAIMVGRSIFKVPVSYAEVESGKIVDSSIFNGIVLRDETVVRSPADGYLNYYIHDGERAAKGSRVCMIDTLGIYTAGVQEDSRIQFSSDDYSDIKDIISVYTNDYSNSRFSDIYTFKYDLQNKITEIVSNQSIDSAGDAVGSSAVKNITAPDTGIISYSYDGMEDLKAEDITDDMFNYASHQTVQLTSNEQIRAGTPAFKLTRDSNWSIIIRLNSNQAAILGNEEVVRVKFTKDDVSTWAYVDVYANGDSIYAKLDISRYMVRYITDRYLEIELVTAEAEGLKIPTTSLVTKDFYTIPEEYRVTDPESGEPGFYKYNYSDTNEMTVELVKPVIYQTKDGLCYVDMKAFNLGDYIGDGSSQEGLYRIGATDTVYGVYNMNQGYTAFRIVNILYQNDSYCIIEENTTYGVSLYDHIVLNASAVDEEEVIN